MLTVGSVNVICTDTSASVLLYPVRLCRLHLCKMAQIVGTLIQLRSMSRAANILAVPWFYQLCLFPGFEVLKVHLDIKL